MNSQNLIKVSPQVAEELEKLKIEMKPKFMNHVTMAYVISKLIESYYNHKDS